MENKNKLKVSRYTFLIENNNRFYLYNTLSNALLEIDKELYRLLSHHKANNDYLEYAIEDELISSLMDAKFITENDEDNFLIYKSFILTQRSEKQSLILTIAPTMDCCFNCYYCFERTKTPTYMSENVMNGIKKMVHSMDNLKIVKITWFGGEPLMAVPQMEQLYRKLRRGMKKIQIISNIITTGFHLTEANIKALQRIKVSNMQITLDGMKETHNNIKVNDGCEDVFSVVLDNIETACKIAPEIHIVIRVNLTKSNASEYPKLQDLIYHRFAGKNIAIAPAFVMDRDNCGHTSDTNLFNAKEYPNYILNLSKSGIDSPQGRYPDKYITECAIRNPYSLSFDPEGNVYKCWEHIGNTKYSIGKINKNGIIENIEQTLLNRQMYGADPLEDPHCRKCPYLPICSGGCPIQRVENVFNDGNNSCCTYYKNHIDAFILEHIKRKKTMKIIDNDKI